jgi:hypothetical protein
MNRFRPTTGSFLQLTAMFTAPLVVIAVYLITPTAQATQSPSMTLADAQKALDVVVAHRAASFAGLVLTMVAAALLIPAVAGVVQPKRERGGLLVTIGVTLVQISAIVTVALSFAIGAFTNAVTAPSIDTTTMVRPMYELYHQSLGYLGAFDLLAPIGCVVLAVGLVLDPALRWRGVVLPLGLIGFFLIPAGIVGVFAGVIMLAGFALTTFNRGPQGAAATVSTQADTALR